MLGHLKAYFIYPLAERYLKRDIRSKLKILQENNRLSFSQRQERKKRMLHSILVHSFQNVPYYRRIFKEINFVPDLILKDLNYIKDIPFLTKEIIHEEGINLLDENKLNGPLHQRKTGGSTGISTIINYDNQALDWTAAANLYALQFTGRKHHDLEVHLSTNFNQKIPLKANFIEQVKCWAMNRTNLQTDSLNDYALAEVWKKLKRIRPYLIQGHPSTLYTLAKYIEKSGDFDKSAITVFESTGETLDSKKLETIEANVGCKVFNRLGNAEFGVVAHSRENPNEMEVIDYLAHVEALSLGNGLDEIILSTTTNTIMPLIRYRTGDIAEVKVRDNREYITNMQGRIHDLIEINDKIYPTHYIQDVLDRVSLIDEFQIVKRVEDRPLLKIVANQATDKLAISQKVKEIFSNGVDIVYTDFNGLTKSGWRDKFRYVVTE